MPQRDQDLGFPLVFSQEDLSLLEGLISRGRPRTVVLNVALTLAGVSKAQLAARMQVHPSLINHLFNASDISAGQRDRLMEQGIPARVLPPVRDGAAA